MVKGCCVVGCKSSWRPSCKTSFHKFPKRKDLYLKWLEVLTVSRSGEHQLVCCRHFKDEDFMQRKKVKRLKSDAIPSYNLISDNFQDCEDDWKANRDFIVVTSPPGSPASDDGNTMSGVAGKRVKRDLTSMLPITTKYAMCRICLATDRDLVHMNERNLLELYQQLIGAEVGDSLPQHVCWECARRLRSYTLFRNRAIQANGLLLTVPTDNSYIYISSKLKDHFASKLNVDEAKTHPDFEYTYSTMKQENDSETAVDTDCTDDESIDERVYLEIDEIETKIDVKNFETTTLDDQTMDSDDNVSLPDTKPLISSDTEYLNIKSDSMSSLPENKINILTTLSEPALDKKSGDTIARKKVEVSEIKDISLNKDIIEVTELSHDEQMMNFAKRQDSSGFKDAKFKCYRCYRGYMDRDMYNWHMSRHDIKNGAHECNVCKVRFSRVSLLKEHVVAEHAMKYSCKHCPFVTFKSRIAKQHEDLHNGTKFQCPYCPQTFTQSTEYFGHVRLQHPPDSACDQCGYMFLGEKGVDFHKQLKHKLDEAPLEGPYCEVCDVKFATEEAHERHLRLSPRHTSDQDPNRIPTYLPILLKKKFLAVHGHKKTSTSIECDQCGATLKNMKSYSQHVRRTHPHVQRARHAPPRKPGCMCEQCGKIFTSPCLLRDHMWVHAGRGKPFSCDVCAQTFAHKSSLAAHARAHAAPRDHHHCPDCGKRFLYRHNMLKHMFVHTGLKPFECESCGKTFATRHQRNAHFEHVHLKKPWPARPNRYQTRRAQHRNLEG